MTKLNCVYSIAIVFIFQMKSWKSMATSSEALFFLALLTKLVDQAGQG